MSSPQKLLRPPDWLRQAPREKSWFAQIISCIQRSRLQSPPPVEAVPEARARGHWSVVGRSLCSSPTGWAIDKIPDGGLVDHAFSMIIASGLRRRQL